MEFTMANVLCWRPLALGALSILIGCWTPTSTMAQTGIVDIHIGTDVLEKLLWDYFYVQEVCALDEFVFEPGSPPVVLDRIDIPRRPGITDWNGTSVPAEFFMRPPDCLTRDCDASDILSPAPSFYDTWPVELKYNWRIEGDTRPSLCASLDGVEYGSFESIAPDQLPPALVSALGDIPCYDLPMELIERFLPDGARFSRWVIGVVEFGLFIRLEIDGPYAENGGPGLTLPNRGNLLSSEDWSIRFGKDVIERHVREEMARELDCVANPKRAGCERDFDGDGVLCEQNDNDDPGCDAIPGFRLTAGPVAELRIYPPDEYFDIHLSGQVPAGATVCPNDVDVDVINIVDVFRDDQATDDWLLHDVSIAAQASQADLEVCAVQAGLGNGPAFTAVSEAVLGALSDALSQGVGDSCDALDPDCRSFCVAGPSGELLCPERFDLSRAVDFDGPSHGRISLEGARAGSLGGESMTLSGKITIEPKPAFANTPVNPGVPRKPLEVGDGALLFGVQGSCSNLHTGYGGSFTIDGQGEMCSSPAILGDPPSDQPIGVARMYGLDWPDGTPATGTPTPNGTVQIQFPRTPGQAALDEFFAAPYPLRALIRTSTGLQHRTIDAPAEAAPGQALEELTEAMAQCLGRRWQMTMPRAVLEMLWLVDPPPFEVTLAGDRLRPSVRAVATFKTFEAALMTDVDFEASSSGDRVWAAPQVAMQGELALDFGKLGVYTLPFRETRDLTAAVTDLTADGTAELTLARPFGFTVKAGREHLPDGIAGANVTVEIPAHALQLSAPWRSERPPLEKRRRPPSIRKSPPTSLRKKGS